MVNNMKEKLEQRLVELVKTEAAQIAQINQLDSLLGQSRAILNMIQGRKAELNELIELSNTDDKIPINREKDLNLPPLDDNAGEEE